ncbi:VanZ family protein [Liquorilactobacillus uvarum]|uniref:VanZ family protein n=1 Tax=Liquorilactobacillus uvarum TaxID=303240 RepID=UPI00288B94F7|nr:VanZ family protein [Liquorilactobacillus uvarum]
MAEIERWVPFVLNMTGLAVAIKMGISRLTEKNIWKIFTVISLGVYLFIVGYLVFSPTPDAYREVPAALFRFGTIPINIIPFKYIDTGFFLNILMTVPLGGYLFLIKRLNLKQVILFGFGVGASIEFSQFIYDLLFHISRWIDINDVITNALGVIIGYGFVVLLKKTGIKKFVQLFEYSGQTRRVKKKANK